MSSVLVHFPAAGVSTAPLPTKRIEPADLSHSITTSGPVAVTRIDQLHWVDPILANAFMHQFSNAEPVPKDGIGDALIARSVPVGRLTLFQSAKDPTQEFYLPSFEIRQDKQQYAVRFAAIPGSTSWSLDVTVVEKWPDELNAPPLPAKLEPLQPPQTRLPTRRESSPIATSTRSSRRSSMAFPTFSSA
ncbi:MAG TPA: hypothetical protein VFF06_03755 [Polyangia bacterium]|nr:hypothetical protein [Polyangia bacterium]